MANDHSGETDDTGSAAPESGTGRRQADRRQSQQPFDGPDRRKGDRRTRTDRRTTPRSSGDESAND